jgi:hypothetical protein
MLTFKEYFEEAELAQRLGHKGFTGRVFVYFNINLSAKLKTPMFSIQDIKTGRVIGHENSFTVRDGTFKVLQSGNERVRREGKKNVHAGVVGYLVHEEPQVLPIPVTYNPYKYNTFVKVSDESPVQTADLISFKDKKLTADGVK